MKKVNLGTDYDKAANAVFIQLEKNDEFDLQVKSKTSGYGGGVTYYKLADLETARAQAFKLALEIQNEWGKTPKLLDETYYNK